MSLLLEIVMWLGAGLLAAAALAPRQLALSALAACSSALSFGALARIAAGMPWDDGEIHVFGMVAAAFGAALGALAVRALRDGTSSSRGPRSYG